MEELGVEEEELPVEILEVVLVVLMVEAVEVVECNALIIQ